MRKMFSKQQRARSDSGPNFLTDGKMRKRKNIKKVRVSTLLEAARGALEKDLRKVTRKDIRALEEFIRRANKEKREQRIEKWKVKAFQAVMNHDPIPPKKITMLHKIKMQLPRLSDRDLSLLTQAMNLQKTKRSNQRIATMARAIRGWKHGDRVAALLDNTQGTINECRPHKEQVTIEWDNNPGFSKFYTVKELVNSGVHKLGEPINV